VDIDDVSKCHKCDFEWLGDEDCPRCENKKHVFKVTMTVEFKLEGDCHDAIGMMQLKLRNEPSPMKILKYNVKDMTLKERLKVSTR